VGRPSVGAPSSYVRRSEWGVPPWAPHLPTFADRSGASLRARAHLPAFADRSGSKEREREREREREKILDFSGLPNEP